MADIDLHFHVTKERVAALTMGEKMLIEASDSGETDEITVADMVHLLARFVQVEQISQRVIEADMQPTYTEEVREWVFPPPKQALRMIKALNDEQVRGASNNFIEAIKVYAVPPTSGNK